MVYQPSKQHLDQQIPEACKAINTILRELKKETGADDRLLPMFLKDSPASGLRISTATDSASADQRTGQGTKWFMSPFLNPGADRLRRGGGDDHPTEATTPAL